MRSGLVQCGLVSRWQWLILRTEVASPGSGDILAIGRESIRAGARCGDHIHEMFRPFHPTGDGWRISSNETGADEIYVVPFPNTGAGKWAISAGGNRAALVHRGGGVVLSRRLRRPGGRRNNTNPRFSLGRSAALFPAAGFTSLRAGPQYAVAPDDRRFLMIPGRHTDKLIVVENWFEELRRSRGNDSSPRTISGESLGSPAERR